MAIPMRTAGAVRVGIVGPSCSGKSTVARIVAERLGARMLTLDDYYIRGHDRRFVDHPDGAIKSFDHPGAYDGAALLRDIQAETGPVVAEGFLLFAYPGLAEALSPRFFVDIGWDEIRRRRAARSGQTSTAVDASFERIGQSEWELFGAPQANHADIVRLDGMRSPQELSDAVVGLLAAGSGKA